MTGLGVETRRARAGLCDPFPRQGEERSKMRLLHGRPVRREGEKKKREESKVKGARGGGVRGPSARGCWDGALPSRRLKLSQGGDARGIDFVIASGSAALQVRALKGCRSPLEPAGARWSSMGLPPWVLMGWTAGDPPC